MWQSYESIEAGIPMAGKRDENDALKFPVLIGDIGGTNARFSLLVDAFADPKPFPVIQTADFETIDDAIQATVLDKTSIQPKSAVLAVAGPVDGDEIDIDEPTPPAIKTRDWRDVERLKEERRLRSLIEDDLDIE